MGGISWPQILIILAIVVLLFGTKRLRNIGSDLGSAVKGFKKSMAEDDKQQHQQQADAELTDDSSKTTAQQGTKQADKQADKQDR